MSLQNAVYALNELGAGWEPDPRRVSLGVAALDPLLGQAECNVALLEAASTLDLYLAQGIGPYQSEPRRARARYLAAAVHRAIDRG